MYKYSILGANGAIGKSAYASLARLVNQENIFKPRSKELNLYEENSSNNLKKSSQDIIVLSVGSYGGLKQYSQKKSSLMSDSFYDNQYQFCKRYIKSGGTIINISSAALENLKNLDEESKYNIYCKEKMFMEDKLFSLSNVSIINLRPTNILSKNENLMTSKHVFASMYRQIKNANSVCKIWSSSLDWREFTTDVLLEKTFQKIFLSVLNQKQQNKKITVSFGSGKKVKIMTLAEEIKYALQKKNLILKADQPYKNGPLNKIIGQDLLKKYFEDWEDLDFNLRAIVKDIVSKY